MIGLAICSIVTLGAATRNLIPGQPHYYVDRQAIYLIVGLRADARALAPRLRAPAPAEKRHLRALLIFSILAVLALGHTARGSQRAINLPFFSFQASELGKVLLIARARRRSSSTARGACASATRRRA